ncbi:Hypothetical predicted protein [Olea europaea subsp. europaea]|uniref:Uncharacterized protein n=1 Tax=Olea europaea subsp. europaea TaxID=158383 RepID=A0A8S0REB8_OLEEU|nr:Hypothetical predicted protein [Olea europaea subsp. europaea]
MCRNDHSTRNAALMYLSPKCLPVVDTMNLKEAIILTSDERYHTRVDKWPIRIRREDSPGAFGFFLSTISQLASGTKTRAAKKRHEYHEHLSGKEHRTGHRIPASPPRAGRHQGWVGLGRGRAARRGAAWRGPGPLGGAPAAGGRRRDGQPNKATSRSAKRQQHQRQAMQSVWSGGGVVARQPQGRTVF